MSRSFFRRTIAAASAFGMIATAVHAEGMSYGLTFKESCRTSRAEAFKTIQDNYQTCLSGRRPERCADTKSAKEQEQFDFCWKQYQRDTAKAAQDARRAAQPKSRRP